MLIWLRRAIASFLIVLFVPVFLVVLLLLQLNSTVLDSDFYKRQLRQADIYNFLYEDWVVAEVDKQLQETKDPPISKLLTGRQVVSYAKRIAPPEYLQTQTEQVIGQVVPYVTGDQDSFAITVSLQERADAALEVLRDFVGDPATYNFLFDEMVTPAVRDNMEAITGPPLGMKVTDQQVVDGLKEVVAQEWVRAQADNVVDTAGPYITGRKDTFTLTVPLADRAEAALGVVQRFIRDANVYDLLFDQVIAPAVQGNLGNAVQLPFGISITDAEVVGAVKEVVTREWVQGQVDNLAGAMGPYITGQRDSFTLVVDLADRKQAATRVVEDMADRKLRTLVDSLPVCTQQQLLELLQSGLSGQVPPCKPVAFTYDQLKQALGIDLAGPVRQVIEAQLPSSFTFTDTDLRRLLTPDTAQRLDDVRKTLREGFTFTDADLRRILGEQGGEEAAARLDDVRETIREGFTFTDADLREQIEKQEGGEETLRQMDQARSSLGRARALSYPAGLALFALFLLAIGFLGGRGWWGRLRWAAVALALATAVALALAIVAQGFVATLVDTMDLSGDGMPQQVADKVVEVVTNVASDFIGGVRGRAITYLVIGLAGVAASIVGPVLLRRRQAQQQVDGGGGPA
ncbi:MAG: hypothetical protein HYY00_09445 [Chloroflexi bacterium]|nr:hypothetical protein [Chloroflexota bacterium]